MYRTVMTDELPTPRVASRRLELPEPHSDVKRFNFEPPLAALAERFARKTQKGVCRHRNTTGKQPMAVSERQVVGVVYGREVGHDVLRRFVGTRRGFA